MQHQTHAADTRSLKTACGEESFVSCEKWRPFLPAPPRILPAPHFIPSYKPRLIFPHENSAFPSVTYSFCNTLERKATNTIPQKQILDVGLMLGPSLSLQTRESCGGCPRTMSKVSHSGEKFVCFCPILFCLGLMLRDGTP